MEGESSTVWGGLTDMVGQLALRIYGVDIPPFIPSVEATWNEGATQLNDKQIRTIVSKVWGGIVRPVTCKACALSLSSSQGTDASRAKLSLSNVFTADAGWDIDIGSNSWKHGNKSPAILVYLIDCTADRRNPRFEGVGVIVTLRLTRGVQRRVVELQRHGMEGHLAPLAQYDISCIIEPAMDFTNSIHIEQFGSEQWFNVGST